MADETTSLVLEATPEQLRAAAEPQLLEASLAALEDCVVDGEDHASCDGGAVAVVDDATDTDVSWRVDGPVELAQETVSAQNWRTAATLVATWTDDAGVAREQRFDLTGQAAVVSVTDEVQTVVQWTRTAR